MWALFAYGTLMQGECRGGLVQAAKPLRIVPGRTRGRLVDLGEYPGLVPAETRGQWVHGELAEFPEWEEPRMHPLLAELDRIEEYRPEAEPASLYLRRVVRVDLRSGPEAWAWAYLYNRPYDSRRVIRSGDWRQRGT